MPRSTTSAAPWLRSTISCAMRVRARPTSAASRTGLATAGSPVTGRPVVGREAGVTLLHLLVRLTGRVLKDGGEADSHGSRGGKTRAVATRRNARCLTLPQRGTYRHRA